MCNSQKLIDPNRDWKNMIRLDEDILYATTYEKSRKKDSP